MTDEFGYKILLDAKLLNLPIVNTLAYLYRKSHIAIVNKVWNVYFNDTSQIDFRIKEVEHLINQDLMVS